MPQVVRRALLLAMLLTSCGAGQTPARQDPVLLEPVRNPEEVRAAAVRAINALHFVAEADEPGRIIARYDHRGTLLRATIEYSDRQFQVDYVEGSGEASQDPATGAVLVDGDTSEMLQRLSMAIQREIRRPEHEAAVTAERQRRHEADVANQQRRAAEAEFAAEQLRQTPPPVVQPAPPVVTVPSAPVPSGGGTVFHHNVQQRHSDQSFHCCINGAYFSCPSQEAFSSCATSGGSSCARQSSNDGRCR